MSIWALCRVHFFSDQFEIHKTKTLKPKHFELIQKSDFCLNFFGGKLFFLIKITNLENCQCVFISFAVNLKFIHKLYNHNTLKKSKFRFLY